MEFWVIVQMTLNLVLLGGGVICWVRLNRPPKDDPRLNSGLQLLQSKIAVLEDLSDRTDRQYQQMSQLIEQKTKTLQDKMFLAKDQILALEVSMQKSIEVAEIFQDKIPHEEIIERQNTIKYVKAAQLAHRGLSVEQILEQVDLPKEQLDFIAKVNKDQLVFDEAQLPGWVQRALRKNHEAEIEESAVRQQDWLESTYVAPAVDESTQESLRALGDKFREACLAHEDRQLQLAKNKVEQVSSVPTKEPTPKKAPNHTIEVKLNQIRKVVFPSV